MIKRHKKFKMPQTGGVLLPGAGRGGVHKNHKNPTGKELRKAHSGRDWRFQ